jgi:hypothetical protein
MWARCCEDRIATVSRGNEVTGVLRHPALDFCAQGMAGESAADQSYGEGEQNFEKHGRHVGTRTPDLYRVKVAL